jgi:hypothetical protein
MDSADLPTDLRVNPSLTKFKDVGGLAKSYVELQSALGGDKIALPGKDAAPEEWNEVFNKLGRPETVEGYELSDWQPPENVPWHSEEATTAMIEKMHSHGLSKSQAQGILNDYAELQSAQHNAAQEHALQINTETVESLKSKWGAAFPVKMENARKASLALVEKAGLDENPFEMELSDGRKIGDLPGVIQVIAALGEEYSEDAGPGPGVGRTTSTPDEAGDKLAAMYADANTMKILNDSGHPQHKMLYEKMTALQKQQWSGE